MHIKINLSYFLYYLVYNLKIVDTVILNKNKLILISN